MTMGLHKAANQILFNNNVDLPIEQYADTNQHRSNEMKTLSLFPGGYISKALGGNCKILREEIQLSIINVSSWAGLYASKLTGPAYNATKRAVLALTESINMEECTHGIRATSLLPGEVATPILDKRPVPPSAEQRELMVQAEDMGQAILFVAQMPERTCINELIISPTFNRFYTGGLETPPKR